MEAEVHRLFVFGKIHISSVLTNTTQLIITLYGVNKALGTIGYGYGKMLISPVDKQRTT